VHGIRTGIKRMRAMLLALKPGLDPVFFQRETDQLKGAAELLAGNRDLTVALKTLRKLARPDRPEAERKALEAVRRWLEEAAPHEAGTGLAAACRNVGRSLRSYVAAPGWVGGFEAGWEDLWQGVCCTHQQGRKRRKKALRSGKSRAFHRWRIRVKALYYQLQWLEPLWPRKLQKLVRQLEKLEKCLGRLHDLAVLRQMISDHLRGREKVGLTECAIECLDLEACRRRCSAEKRAKKVYAKLCGSFWRKLQERGKEYDAMQTAEFSAAPL
jgi:CHAD domain-containing protein